MVFARCGDTRVGGRPLADISDIPDHPQLAAHLERRYGIDVAELSRLQTWSPFVHRVNRHDGPPWVARLFPVERPMSRVTGDAEILQFLAGHNFPAERLADAKAVSNLDGYGVLVTEYVDGTLFEEFERDAPRRQVEGGLRMLGELLGHLHALPLRDGAVMRDGGSWHYDLNEGLPCEDIAGAAAMLDAVDDRVPADYRERHASLREQLAAADDCGDLPHALVHPDFGGPNVILKTDDSPIVVDWTGAGRGPRVVSLAWLLSCCRASYQVDAVVAGYRTRVRLEDEELSRLSAAMRIRLLFFACRGFWRAIAAGRPPVGWGSAFGTAADNARCDAIAARARDGFEGRARR
jgi:Ser/Thr protein kinase RdoA (MazF antagonist)